MALARTFRTSGATTTNPGTASWASGSFTPSSSSLLVVGMWVVDNGLAADVTADMTVSGGGWTYTGGPSIGGAGSFQAQAKIWTAPVTTGASMSLTFDCGTRNIYSSGWFVWDFTGYNTGTPTGGTFRLAFKSVTTGNIAFNASAASLSL